jgi:hypothetical protein
MAAVPADSDPLAGLPSDDTLADRIHHSDDFMSWDSGVFDTWKNPILYNRVAVTNPARLYLDSNRSSTWLRDFTVHDFKGSRRSRDLNCAHCWHNPPVVILVRP